MTAALLAAALACPPCGAPPLAVPPPLGVEAVTLGSRPAADVRFAAPPPVVRYERVPVRAFPTAAVPRRVPSPYGPPILPAPDLGPPPVFDPAFSPWGRSPWAGRGRP